ncbi:hypothetical protein ACHWQZ_G016983 [Mnemiopsis leidyi]
MVQSRASTQFITFPRAVNQPHCNMKPIPLISLSRQNSIVSPVQQPFKQIPAPESAYRRYREIPSPGKDIISNIDASVKRVKSAVINRMVETSQKRNNTGQYFGWLLKARLQPLVVHHKAASPTIQECRGIVGCCRGPKLDLSSAMYNANNSSSQQGRSSVGGRRASNVTKHSVQSYIETRAKSGPAQETSPRVVNNTADTVYRKPYRKETVMNNGHLAPIRLITVGKSSHVNMLETKYKCLSAQFCGAYNVPGTPPTSKPHQNVLVPRYGMFNAEECYVYEHDAAYQTSKKPVVLPPKSRSPDSSSFNMELDFMLDKFDSDSEDTTSKHHSDIQRIASKYSHSSGIPGMLDWEEMVTNIADGALDMSGSRRRRKEKKSTKLRSPIMFTEKKKETKSRGCKVKPANLDTETDGEKTDDVTWYDVNSLRFRNG